MEVHAHTHTARKKWTHYFWEFLMLFLAVFCGFLAEYQLEHKIEKERGRQYIISFYEDLKTDTARFNGIIANYERQIEVFKQADDCYQIISKNIKSDSCLVKLMYNSGGFADLVFTDRTLQQLKNAGGLRMLKKDEADSILIYDNLLRIYLKGETTAFQETQYKIRDLTLSIVNHKVFKSQSVQVLYVENAEKINQFFNLLSMYESHCHDNLKKMIQIKNYATTLLEYFKKTYHLK